MKNATIELADVVRRFRHEYAAQFGQVMMPSQKKALEDIASCMTEALGGHRYRCCDCGEEFWICHGCRNRSCPKCHGQQMQEWLERRRVELLPCGYYHLVATVPEELRHAFLADQKFMYSLLMKTVAGTVIDLVKDSKRIGAVPGILMVLHTWTAQMGYHPHVHLLVTAGGVSDDGLHWHTSPGKFLVPVKALSQVIAARFRDALAKHKPHVFRALPRKIWKRAWCSYCQHYGHGKDAVLRYLGRYVFRIALTNARILDMDDTHVTFRYNDRQAGRWRTCRLAGVEFLRRFLMHVLPKGFHKVRYYGLWHPCHRKLQFRARLLLMLESPADSRDSLTIADLLPGLLPTIDDSDISS
ncbi:MAG: transposase, partial [Bacteroidetes bacterium]|nr:transposase [Bacteroidota bacterium]